MWFAAQMNEQSLRHGRPTILMPRPAFTYRVTAGEKAETRAVYQRIHDEHPDAPVVIHVLPGRDTKDYGWLHYLPQPYCLQCG